MQAEDRITFRGTLATAVRALSELDFASVRTVVALARRPGPMVRAWLLEGGRATYANPVKFAFLASTLYVVVNQLSNRSDVAAFLDPLQSYRAFWPYVALLLLLPVAGLQRLLFRGTAFNAAESYAFGLFVFGELALLGTALLALDRLTGLGATFWVYQGGAALYTAWAVTGLYADRRWSVWLRGLFIFAFELGALAALFYGVQRYRFSGLSP